MSTVLALTFAAAGPEATGDWPLTVSPARIATSPLTDSFSVIGLADGAAHGWSPKPGATLKIDTRASAAIFGEFSLDVWIADTAIVEPITLLSGAGSPVELTLVGADTVGSVVATAIVRTTGAPLVLVSDPFSPSGSAPVRLGVWLSGTEAILTVQGGFARRIRFARGIPDPKGDLVVGGPAKDSASIITVVGLWLRDQLDIDQEDTMINAASNGVGEIDSLIASGGAGDLGAPTGAESGLGRMRWRTFERGNVYWSENTGAHAVVGEVLKTHAARGGAMGRLGLPTGPELGLNEVLSRLGMPRLPGLKSGMTAFDVLKKGSALADDDMVVRFERPSRLPRPPKKSPSWDGLGQNDARVSSAVARPNTALDATWITSALGHSAGSDDGAGASDNQDPELRELIAREQAALGRVRGGFGAAPSRRGNTVGQQIGRRSVDRAAHRSAMRLDAGSVFGPRVSMKASVTLAANAGELTATQMARVVRSPDSGTAGLAVHIPRATVTDTLTIAADAVPTFLGRVGEQLASGQINAGQASTLSPHLHLQNAEVTALVERVTRDGESAAIRSGTAKMDKPIADLISASSDQSASISFAVGGAVWTITGPRAQQFQHGIIVYSSGSGGIDVYEQILAHWVMLGGSQGFLGVPRSPETAVVGGAQATADGGRVVVFSGGRIYWSPATGAHEVHGDILARYLEKSSDAHLLFVPSIGEVLGLPLSDEESIAGFGSARRSLCQRGHIYWTPQRGAIDVGAEVLGHFMATGGIGRWGLPIERARVHADGGVTLIHQEFSLGRIAILKNAGGAITALTSLEVGIAQIVSGEIDDDTLVFVNRDAELFVKAQVFVDGRQVLNESSEGQGHDSRIVQPGWVTSAIDTSSARNIRIYVEAWDWDSGPNDLLATYDRTFTADDDFFGYTAVAGSWGSHRGAPSTWNGPDASSSALTFDITIGRAIPVSRAQMRNEHFWRMRNAGRKSLPWEMYRNTFDDIDADHEGDADVFERSTYVDRYEQIADGGNCYGFSTTALDAFHRRGGFPQPLSDKALAGTDDNVYWQAINRGQGSQIATAVSDWRIDAKDDEDFADPRRVYDRVVAGLRDTGAPVILTMYARMAASGARVGHAVLAYDTTHAGGTRTMWIADSNSPWPVPNANSRVEVYDDGSYAVFPMGQYPGWGGSAWVAGSVGDQRMLEEPYWALAQPLRSPAIDMGSGLFGLLGGVISSVGAAIDQVEGGGRPLIGDQRQRLVAESRFRDLLLDSAVQAGLTEAVAAQPAATESVVDSNATLSQRVTASSDRIRLSAVAALVAPDLTGSMLTSRLAEAVAAIPDAVVASASWGHVEREPSGFTDTVVAGAFRPDPVYITPGAWPGVADVSPIDNKIGGPTVIAFRGAVPRDLVVTLRGQGGEYAHTMMARGGVIRVESTLPHGQSDVIQAVALSSARPGVVVRTGNGDRLAQVTFSAGGRVSLPVSWRVQLGIGDTDASVRWMPGRPGITIRHASAAPPARIEWSATRGAQSYAVPAANPGETVRMVPNDPASPFGAIRLQRLSAIGDVLTTEIIDPGA